MQISSSGNPKRDKLKSVARVLHIQRLIANVSHLLYDVRGLPDVAVHPELFSELVY